MKNWLDRQFEVHHLLPKVVLACFVLVCFRCEWQAIMAVGTVLATVFGFRVQYGLAKDAQEGISAIR